MSQSWKLLIFGNVDAGTVSASKGADRISTVFVYKKKAIIMTYIKFAVVAAMVVGLTGCGIDLGPGCTIICFSS